MKNKKKKFITIMLLFVFLVVGALVGNYFRPVKRKVRYYEKGMIFFQKRQYIAAILQFQKALEISPSVEISYQLAHAQFLDGDIVDAIKTIESIITVEPKYKKSHFLLIECYNKQKQYDLSLKISQKFMEIFPGDLEMLNSQGIIYSLQEKNSLAEITFHKIIEQDSANISATVNLANLYQSVKRQDDAIRLLEEYVGKFPDNQQVQIVLARFYYQANQYSKAAEQYDKVKSTLDLQEQQRYTVALTQVGRIQDACEIAKHVLRQNLSPEQSFNMKYILGIGFMFEGKYSKAIEELLWVTSFAPDFANGRYQLGMAYALNKNYLLANYELQKAVELDPKADNMYEIILQIYTKNAAWDEAITMCDEILKNSPDNEAVLNLKARILVFSGNYSDAQKLYQKISSSKGAMGEIIASVLQKDYTNAIAKLDIALKKHPEDNLLKYVAAIIYFEQKDIEKSLHYLISIPNYPNAITILAQIRIMQGNYPLAIEEYLKLLDLFPQNDQICLRLYNLYVTNQQTKEALEVLQKNQKKPETHEIYRQAYAQVYFTEKNYEKALEVLSGSQNKNANNESVKANLYLFLEKYKDAIKLYLSAKELGSPNIDNKIAFCYYVQKNVPEARVHLEKYLETNPNDLNWQFFSVILLMSEAKWEQALTATERLLAKTENNSAILTTHIIRSCIYLQLRQLQEALAEIGKIDKKQKFIHQHFPPFINDCYQKNINFFPVVETLCIENLNIDTNFTNNLYLTTSRQFPFYLVSYYRAIYMYRTAQTKEAEEILLNLIKDNQELTLDAYTLLISTYERTGELEKLKHCFEEVLKIDATKASAILGLAMYYEGQKNESEAIRYYQKVIASSEQDQVKLIALNNLAYIYVKSKTNNEKSLQYAQQAFSLSPYSFEIADTLGYSHYVNQNYKDALRYFSYAHNLNPSSPNVLYHLAMVNHKMGKKEQALAELQKAFDLSLHKKISFTDKEKAEKLFTQLQKN